MRKPVQKIPLEGTKKRSKDNIQLNIKKINCVRRLWVEMLYDSCVRAIKTFVSVTALNPGLFILAFSHRMFLWCCTCSSSFHSFIPITRAQATWCLIHSQRGSNLSTECCPIRQANLIYLITCLSKTDWDMRYLSISFTLQHLYNHEI